MFLDMSTFMVGNNFITNNVVTNKVVTYLCKIFKE